MCARATPSEPAKSTRLKTEALRVLRPPLRRASSPAPPRLSSPFAEKSSGAAAERLSSPEAEGGEGRRGSEREILKTVCDLDERAFNAVAPTRLASWPFLTRLKASSRDSAGQAVRFRRSSAPAKTQPKLQRGLGEGLASEDKSRRTSLKTATETLEESSASLTVGPLSQCNFV